MALKRFGISILSLVMTSCQSALHYPHPPKPLPEILKPEKPIRVALVLGGGGVRGLAHAGVLEELENAHIPIDMIVGCSAGSIVGALYANQPDARLIMEALKQVKRSDLLKVSWLDTRYGFVHGGGLQALLNKHLGNKEFSDLKILLRVVASDLQSGELVTLGGGEVIPAVHASSAVPFVFKPVSFYGRTLVDGGVVDPIPVRIAKEDNPIVIIAVDLSQTLPNASPSHLLGIAKRCAEITYLKHCENCALGADILIKPKVGHIGIFEDNCAHEIYEAGRRATREVMPQILEALQASSLSEWQLTGTQ